MTSPNFEDFSLAEDLLKNLKSLNFNCPTPIQNETIPLIMAKKDIVAQAETGSGKTGAFIIPLIHRLVTEPAEDLFITKGEGFESRPIYVVMTPTRELAQQIQTVTNELSKEMEIKSACIIGGESVIKQKDILGKGVHILTATPGRLKDLFQQKLISFKNVKGIVLDEADRLLDMGFKDDILYLLNKMPKSRQVMLFSATNNIEVLNISYKIHANPQEINLSRDTILVDNICHSLAQVGDNEKMPLLVGYLKAYEDTYALIFCNTKSETGVVALWLNNLGFKAQAISGDLPQSKRTKLLADFRSKEINILVCTDVAARGLDIKDVTLVINYDLPQDPSNYVHRIGRTGRAGTDGKAISFCAFKDCEFLEPIEQYIESKIPKEFLTNEMFAKDIGRRPRIQAKMDPRKESASFKNKKNDKKTFEKKEGVQRKKPDEKRTPIKRTPEKRIEVKDKMEVHANHTKTRKERTTKIEATNWKKARVLALPFFAVKNAALVDHRITKVGKRTFFGFGPKMKTFEFFIKPEYEIILNDFLHNLFSKTPLEISFKVKGKKEEIDIHLNGPDESFLLVNDGEFLDALEYLIRKYLNQLMVLPRNLKIRVNCGDFVNTHESKLEKMAKKMADKVVQRKSPMVLEPMSPADRYIVHQFLSKDKRVSTSSLGNGHYKKIRIMPGGKRKDFSKPNRDNKPHFKKNNQPEKQ